MDQVLTVRTIRFSETTASVLLDAIRGTAAILVLLGHWRNAFFVDFTQIHVHRGLLSPLYLVCAAGHQAVVVFFVLSGYLISGSIFRSVQRNEWRWGQYLTHRLVRLWIVLLPALALGALWDRLGIYLNHAPALYSGAHYNHITPDVVHALSLQDLIGNIAFVQTILVPAYGSNGALWSLANEFWYYLLFPLAICIFGGIYKRPVQVIICAILICLISVFVTKSIWLLFPIWLLGALLHAVPHKPTALWLRIVVSAIYVVLFFGIAMLDHGGWIGAGVLSDSILGMGTFGFVWVLLGAVRKTGQSPSSTLSRWIAKFSYTLYVAHTPLLIFLTSLMTQDTRWVPTVKSGCVALSVLVVVIVYAWLLATVTEFKTEQVRAWTESKVLKVGDRIAPDRC